MLTVVNSVRRRPSLVYHTEHLSIMGETLQSLVDAARCAGRLRLQQLRLIKFLLPTDLSKEVSKFIKQTGSYTAK